jgi:hypothetical protein
LVAIDDPQWLDAPSTRVLEFAVRRLNEVPIGLATMGLAWTVSATAS